MPWSARPRALRLAAFAALLLPALAGCVPADFTRTPVGAVRQVAPAQTGIQAQAAAAQAPQEVHLTVKEWSFSPTALDLPLNQPVKLVVDNKGALDHDLTIPQLNVKVALPAGKTTQATVTAGKEGSFQFLCSIPGHLEAGMKGTATVSSSVGAADHAHDASAVAASVAERAPHVSHDTVVSTEKQGLQELKYRLDGDVKVFDLAAQHVQWEVLPGEFIDAYAYNGMVPGPVIRVTEGDRIRVNLKNELPEATVLHFHGPTLPNNMDGVPDVTQKPIEPGETFTYEFTAKPTGTFVYHTHHNSAEQETKGLYGVLIVEPKVQSVKYDKELIQVLGESGGYFLINGKSFPATQPLETKVGEKVLIRLINLGQMTHPMHLHGHPFKIVATDGYPVPESQQLTKDVINIGPGERYDLEMDASNPGTWVFHCHILTHVQNHGVEPGGMLTVIKVDPA